ncbi:MAG TPA: hypothetical protein VIX14_13025 [Terriglobales bacterium]
MKIFPRKTNLVVVSWIIVGLFTVLPSLASDAERVQVKLDTSESEQLLAIVTRRKQAQPITDADWQALFATELISA